MILLTLPGCTMFVHVWDMYLTPRGHYSRIRGFSVELDTLAGAAPANTWCFCPCLLGRRRLGDI